MLNVKLFEGVSPLEHEALLKRFCRFKEYGKNASVIVKGENSKELFIVVSGSVAVSIAENHEIRFEQGDFFGEMSFIDGLDRSARVYVPEGAVLAVTNQAVFEKIQEKAPKLAMYIYANIAKELVRRIRLTNALVGESALEAKRAVENEAPAWFLRVKGVLSGHS